MKFLVGVLEGTAEHTFSVYNAIAQKFIFLLDVPRFLLALLKLALCFLPGILVCHYAMHNSTGHLSMFWLVVGCALKLATAWLIVRAFKNSMSQQRRRRRRYYMAVSPANAPSRSASRRRVRTNVFAFSSRTN